MPSIIEGMLPSLIAGQAYVSASAGRIEVRNPSTASPLLTIAEGAAGDADAAVVAAQQAL